MFILIVSIAPVAALLIYFYKKDKYEKEPLKLLAKAFGGGVLITFFVLLVGIPISIAINSINNFILQIFLRAFVGAAFLEEAFKFCAFKFIIYRNKEFNEPYDGILYAVMVSLGFAALENIGYLINAHFDFGFLGIVQVGAMRAIFAVPAHAMFGVIMGYYLGLAKFSRDENLEYKYILKGLGFAILAHGLYDFFLFTGTWLGFSFMVVLFLVCVGLSMKAMRIHIENSPFKE
jgi:RsiW-degrading membrane proteinase PrsW (M82 family)